MEPRLFLPTWTPGFHPRVAASRDPSPLARAARLVGLPLTWSCSLEKYFELSLLQDLPLHPPGTAKHEASGRLEEAFGWFGLRAISARSGQGTRAGTSAPLLRSAGKAWVNAPAWGRRAQACGGRLSELPRARVLWFPEFGRLDSTQWASEELAGPRLRSPLCWRAVGEGFFEGLRACFVGLRAGAFWRGSLGPCPLPIGRGPRGRRIHRHPILSSFGGFPLVRIPLSALLTRSLSR